MSCLEEDILSSRINHLTWFVRRESWIVCVLLRMDVV